MANEGGGEGRESGRPIGNHAYPQGKRGFAHGGAVSLVGIGGIEEKQAGDRAEENCGRKRDASAFPLASDGKREKPRAKCLDEDADDESGDGLIGRGPREGIGTDRGDDQDDDHRGRAKEEPRGRVKNAPPAAFGEHPA